MEIGLDRLVLVNIPSGPHHFRTIALNNDHDSTLFKAFKHWADLRTSALAQDRWEERPRTKELPALLDAASTEPDQWYFLDEVLEVISEESGVKSHLVERIVDAFWELAVRAAEDDEEDLTFFLGRHPLSEAEIEDWLAANLGLLRPFGYELALWSDEAGRIGRQYVLPNKSRPDLICRSVTDDAVWVLELKAWPCLPSDVDQVVGYLDALRAFNGVEASGLLITNGTTVAGRAALASAADVHQLNIVDIESGGLLD